MSYKITSKFLQQESFRNFPHKGIDLKMEIGEPLRAICAGKIHLKNFGSSNAGKTILIEGEDGRTYIYGHLSEFNVQEGQFVSQGDLIGLSGNSGFSTGAHLHFAVREGEKFLDPSPHIDFIQNMNNPQFLASLPSKKESLTQAYSMFDVLKDAASTYSDFFQSLKLNIVYLFNSIDYSMFVQYLQHFMQFFS
ncbi:M23 family metallopeptidase [Metabacillus arenae]|uniref:M23 family metallopeptidase n=1 Tax=Metabacillus arenae TaxID=2771434 RepID=A0A926RZL9_9BACI|nr:M23 family metallopeptidase [Metabacillus arenae]MBD1379189.1 M23 family metallopeptidase [Metabacillus arenae]